MTSIVHLRTVFFICVALVFFVTFQAPAAFAMPPEQEARVVALLALLAQEKDTVFIRNGSEHSAEEAVRHLQLKFGKTKKRLSNAEQFIDKAASSSSISGKPYFIRKPGEKEQSAGPYLHQLLKRLDN